MIPAISSTLPAKVQSHRRQSACRQGVRTTGRPHPADRHPSSATGLRRTSTSASSSVCNSSAITYGTAATPKAAPAASRSSVSSPDRRRSMADRLIKAPSLWARAVKKMPEGVSAGISASFSKVCVCRRPQSRLRIAHRQPHLMAARRELHMQHRRPRLQRLEQPCSSH